MIFSGKEKDGDCGFTLIELLVSIAILLLIMGGAVSFLASYREIQLLNTDGFSVYTLVNEARNNTLHSKGGGSEYGIHFGATSTVLFKGLTFVNGAPDNKVLVFNPAIEAATTVSGGGMDVTFDRLTGEASTTATTTLTYKSNPTKQYIIIVNKSGVVSSQN